MRYIKPTINIYRITARPLLAGSPTIGFTNKDADTSKDVLSKQGTGFNPCDDDNEDDK